MIKLKEIELYNTKLIVKACADAMTNKKMIGIVDYSGAGKSFALDKFNSENEGVFKIELGVSMTPKEMYAQILNQVMKQDITRMESSSQIIRQLRQELTELSGSNLIIIDEASRYKKEKVSYFHELRNLTQNNCGLIISGHKDYENMLSKWSSSGVLGVEEFENRFSYFIKLIRPQDHEITLLFKENDLLKTKKGNELHQQILKLDKKKLNWRKITNLIIENLP